MERPELHLSFWPDTDGTGELIAQVNSAEFSGCGKAWFGEPQLRKKFVPALRAYPLSINAPPMIEGGYWDGTGASRLEQCHLRIAIRPYDIKGNLLVQVDLATASQIGPDTDLQQSVTARFLTEYAALDRFASELLQVLDAKRDVAVLIGKAT